MPLTSFSIDARRRTIPFSTLPIRRRFIGTIKPSCFHSLFIGRTPTDQRSFRSKSMMWRRSRRGFTTSSSRILVTILSRYGFGGVVRRCVLRC
jgi:hypothetical protein